MNSKSPLFKYQIGLAVLGLVTLGLVIFLIVQGNASRQDTKTHKAAVEVSEKINLYVSRESKVPESLASLDAGDVPGTVTYEKLSDEKYRFCVTYKADSKGMSASEALTGALSSAYGVPYPYGDYSSTDYLYVPSSYKKGENCQTIEPYLYDYSTSTQSFDLNDSNSNGSMSNSLNSDPYSVCGQTHNYAWTSLRVEDISADSITVYSSPWTTFEVADDVQVFDTDCKTIEYSSIKVGDTVGLYFNPYGSPVSTIVKQ